MSWEPARDFTAAVSCLYGILALVALILFIRKLAQTLRLRADRLEARLLDEQHQHDESNEHSHLPGGGAGGASGAANRGGAAIDGAYGTSGQHSRRAGGGGNNRKFGALPVAGETNHRGFGGYHQHGAASVGTGGGGGRPFAGVRPSIPESDDGLRPNAGSNTGSLNSDLNAPSAGAFSHRSAVAPSEVIVEVRSNDGDNSEISFSRGGNGTKPAYSPRAQVQSACERCCTSYFLDPLRTFFSTLFCLPSSFFAERHNSSLLLLGSMFAYALARSVQVAYDTANWESAQKGAATLYEMTVTSLPAIGLMVLQLSFNLKWVVNVRNISASGAADAFGSRLSLGPARSALSVSSRRNDRRNSAIPPDEANPDVDDFCSCDIGTTALAIGVGFLSVFPAFAFMGMLAYLNQVHTDNKATEYLGISNEDWVKIITGMAAGPYITNGLGTIVLGVILRTVWKPFSQVAIQASLHMFVVAIIWGTLCTVRGFLLLSYDLRTFNHDTHSAWAGPAVLMGEGALIYLVILVFYLSSRNQDQVVAAEKEARRRISRLERTGGVGAEDLPNAQSGRFLKGSEGTRATSTTAKDGTSQQQLGLPIYSTWSSHSQTPSRASGFGPQDDLADGRGGGAGGEQPVQSRLFVDDN